MEEQGTAFEFSVQAIRKLKTLEIYSAQMQRGLSLFLPTIILRFLHL